MVRLRRNVPSLGALAAFESAARLGGFTKAANELGVTQAAISRQIRALETDLKVKLFIRSHRQVILTEAGRTLSEAVGSAFETMSEAVSALREPAEPHALTISTSLSFSHFWLLPRLASFRTANPGIELRVMSQDDAVDLRQGDVDVVIRYGIPPFADGTTLGTLQEELFPLCSPDFAESHGCADIAMERLIDLPLIEAHTEASSWLTFPQWFQRAGLPPVPRQRMLVFSHYSDAVYAAITGQGVVLGWSRLLERPLTDGRLVRLGTTSVTPEEGHHLVVALESANKPAVKAIVRWIAPSFRLAPGR